MLTDVAVFAELDAILLMPLKNFMSQGVAGLAGYLSAPLKGAATLYIALYGWFVLKGSIQEPAMDFVFKCMKIVIITMLATNAAEYNHYITDLFFETIPNEIGSALNDRPLQANAYDSILNAAGKLANDIWDQTEWGASMFMDALLSIIILITGTLLGIIAYVVSFYAKVALSVMIAIGPLFIALALFDSTRRFTEGWLGQLVNFVILQILSVALASLFIKSLVAYVGKIVFIDQAMSAMVSFAAISLSAAYLFYQLPSIASSLAAGGASLSIGSRGNGLESAAGSAYSGAKWLGAKAARLAGRGVGKLK